MPPSWRDGLVNAFPVPKDRVKRLRASGKHGKAEDTPGSLSLRKAGISTLSQEEEEEQDQWHSNGQPETPFRFLDLPGEIRNQIYSLVLFSRQGNRGGYSRRPTSRTAILATSKRTHQEGAYILYSTLSFRIFPVQDFTSKPLVGELRPMYRAMVTKLEMTVGSSWTSPPKTWRVSKLLAKRLSKLAAVQSLRVFVELDPSLPMFEKYRVSFDFYTDFCGDLLRDVLLQLPHVADLEMDGNPGVDTGGPLVTRLLAEARAKGKTCTLGPTKPLPTPTGVSLVFW